ncbi:MAG: nucleotide sugar dehydrogenase [Fibrobacterales bacterium]
MQNKIGIIGLGYVGLPLAIAFGNKFPTIGFDINQKRIDDLNNGIDITHEMTFEELKSAEYVTYTTNMADLNECSYYIVTVPTPIDSNNLPDLSPIIDSTKSIAPLLKQGDIVIYESTVYPGVTEELCVPLLTNGSGLEYNKDFYCGYSPERINPGDKERTLTKILKITSGSTPETADQIDTLYKQIIVAGTYRAPSIKVAEAAKVIENTQRDVNIALINELSHVFDTMGIDTKEVIDAAATKWNFVKLYPGLVGGHCIGVDPYYLTFKATENGYQPNLILAARMINNGMSSFVVEKTIKSIIAADKKVKGGRILILGVTFKEDCPDMRNTKVVDVIEELKDEYGCLVDVYDPWVDAHENKKNYKHGIIENPLESESIYDAIIVAVAHKQFKEWTMDDYRGLSNGVPVIIDVKGIVEEPTWVL